MGKLSSTFIRVCPGLALVAALWLAGCGCDLGDHLSEQAGDGATHCGYVEIDEPREPAHACTVAAFREGRAFYVRFQEQGTDSRIERGIAGDDDGRVWFFTYDGDPGGGGGDDAPEISRSTCVEPRIEQVPDTVQRGDGLPAGTEHIACETLTDHHIVCD